MNHKHWNDKTNTSSAEYLKSGGWYRAAGNWWHDRYGEVPIYGETYGIRTALGLERLHQQQAGGV